MQSSYSEPSDYPLNLNARPIGASDIRELGRRHHLVVKEAIDQHRFGKRAALTFHDDLEPPSTAPSEVEP